MANPQCPLGCDNDYVVAERTYSRIHGCELRGVYDGVAFWYCPECGTEFHRFDPESRVYMAVEAHWVKRGLVSNGQYALACAADEAK